jgi:hypothetical protein
VFYIHEDNKFTVEIIYWIIGHQNQLYIFGIYLERYIWRDIAEVQSRYSKGNYSGGKKSCMYHWEVLL